MNYYFKYLFVLLLITGCTPGTLKYFPAVSGVVVEKGIPVKDAKISLEIYSRVMGGDYLRQKGKSDISGKFHLMESSKFYLLYGPHTHISDQILLIRVNGITYVGIDGERSHSSDFDEYMAVDIVCDISKKQNTYTIKELNGNEYENGFIGDSEYTYSGICVAN